MGLVVKLAKFDAKEYRQQAHGLSLNEVITRIRDLRQSRDRPNAQPEVSEERRDTQHKIAILCDVLLENAKGEIIGFGSIKGYMDSLSGHTTSRLEKEMKSALKARAEAKTDIAKLELDCKIEMLEWKKLELNSTGKTVFGQPLTELKIRKTR